MNDTKKSNRLFMILNCLALGIIAMNLTAPVHEATHLLTQMIAGAKPVFLSFGAADTVDPAIDPNSSFFWKVMYEGSAALMNIVIGFVLLIILKKAKLGSLSRPLVLMTTMMHLSMGFGYFLRDGIAYSPDPEHQMGDWSKVLGRFDGNIILRIGMLVVGSLGILLVFYIAYRQAFHFISDNEDKKERGRVASAIYLFPYILNAVVFTLVELRNPIGIENVLIISPIINIFGMIGFFWGYMFVAHMVKPRKDNVYYVSPCAERKIGLWIIAVAALALDAFVLCPGIYF
ncbi:MAG: hypothetical protein J5756_02280 [Clostridia bacterium]|nr:hypothetical protein [Clostridia bacterium]